MDYEKLYKEANKKVAVRFGSNVAKELFPDLYESEDERIRNEIIDYLSTADDKELIPYESWVAWLEKQSNANKEYWRGYREGKKEILDKYSEHANFLNNIQIGDKVTRNEGGVLVNISQLNRVAKPAKRQSEQKPVDNGESNLLTVERAKKISPFMRSGFENDSAAWSEEDEKNSLDIKCLIGSYRAGDDEYRLDSWIDSLKNRVQPKQEWSKEDEFNYDRLKNFLEVKEHEADSSLYQQEVHKTLDWLKSLKDRYAWKPSESDILLLEKIANGKSNPQDFQASLWGLIGQLKKLRE